MVLEPRHYGEFKVPGLRGLDATAPYFPGGSAATLDSVVQHYSALDETRLHADGARLLQALALAPVRGGSRGFPADAQRAGAGRRGSGPPALKCTLERPDPGGET